MVLVKGRDQLGNVQVAVKDLQKEIERFLSHIHLTCRSGPGTLTPTTSLTSQYRFSITCFISIALSAHFLSCRISLSHSTPPNLSAGCVTRDGEHPSEHGSSIMAKMFAQEAIKWFYTALIDKWWGGGQRRLSTTLQSSVCRGGGGTVWNLVGVHMEVWKLVVFM